MGKSPTGNLESLCEFLAKTLQELGYKLSDGNGKRVVLRLVVDVPIFLRQALADHRFSGASHGVTLKDLLDRNAEQIARVVLSKIDDAIAVRMDVVRRKSRFTLLRRLNMAC